MSIKHKIKIRKVTGIGVHGLATGDSLDLSDDPKGERRSPASDGESIRRDVPADDNVFKDKTISDDYKSGGAYKAILKLFAEQLDDDKFAEHCRKFLKEKMKTIPDAIDDILWYIKRVRDVYYRFFEHFGSKMNVYGWNGRWKNRQKGTGYGKTR